MSISSHKREWWKMEENMLKCAICGHFSILFMLFGTTPCAPIKLHKFKLFIPYFSIAQKRLNSVRLEYIKNVQRFEKPR